MKEITLDFSGFDEMLRKAEGSVKQGAINGVERATEHLFRESEKLAPLKKGTLRASETMDVTADGNLITGEVTYSVTERDDGGRFNYALKLHEMGEYKKPTTPGTQPKFLERPLKEHIDEYNRMIAEEIGKELR